jgi:hypothetical protein
MRRVFEERDEAARVGARASAHVRSLLVPERAVSVIRERLQSRSRQPV